MVLSSLVVSSVIKAGKRYPVTLKGRIPNSALISEVCFLWTGEGPYCWDSFSLDRSKGEIRTRAITRNPRTYQLEGLVRYRVNGQARNSNHVEATISVR